MEIKGKFFDFAIDRNGSLYIDEKRGSFQLFKTKPSEKPLGRRLVIDGNLQVQKNHIEIGSVAIPINAIQTCSLQTIKSDDYLKIGVLETNITCVYYISCNSFRMQNEKTRDFSEIFPILINRPDLKKIENEGQETAEETNEQKMDQVRIETLKTLVAMSEEILVDDLAAALSLSRADLMKQIIKWKDIGLILKGNSVVINNRDDFLNALDQSFKEWESQASSGTGKS